MSVCPAALGLSPEGVEDLLRTAGAAPSLHNRQPWRFRIRRHLIELHADPGSRLPMADPGDRELRLGCGAALLNLRLALEHENVAPVVTLAPDLEATTLLAEIRAGQRVRASSESDALYQAIPRRRTTRTPFRDRPVPAEVRHDLVQAVQREHCWLHVVERGERGHMEGLVHRAHRAQMADPRFRAELARWTGRAPGESEGVPASAAGPEREPQDQWVLRDFSAGRATPREPGRDFEREPLMVVLCTPRRSPASDLYAGQALQRMLLTATGHGLVASLLSQVVEVPETRKELSSGLGRSLDPHAVVRLGFGTPGPPTPRREAEELLLADIASTSGS